MIQRDKKYKIGIIGLGNMGSVIAQTLLKKKFQAFETYNLFDIDAEKLKIFSSYNNVTTTDSLGTLANNSDFILLAVKPQKMEQVLKELKDSLKTNIKGKVFITIAAGLRLNFYRQILGEECYITRVMPNTPLLVGEGAAGITLDSNQSKEISSIIENMFKLAAKVILCDEKTLDIVTGLSGSGPAYIFMVIEAMADGAVKMGLSRQDAYLLAAQTVVGAGKMVLETNSHPGVLKDMVTSPGGTTIEAVSVLEKGGLRSLFIDAVEAATKKAQSFK